MSESSSTPETNPHEDKLRPTAPPHRTGFQTLLFLDMVGSTRLKEELGDSAAVALIHRHHAIVREILSRFSDALEIGTSGDEFFLSFGKPSDAVQFALLLQARLRVFGDAVLRDRVGIHMGEVVIEQGSGGEGDIKDLYGIHVDTCARVMSLGEGDQILMTRGVFDNARLAMKGREMGLFGELSWLNHGNYGLKGVAEPVEVFEVGETGIAVLAAPKDSPKAKRLLGAGDEPVLGWRPAAGQKIPGTGWTLEQKLGEGAVGEVWLGKDRILKSSHVFKFCFKPDRVRSLKREVTLFRVLREKIGNHPHIVSVETTYFDEPPYFIVLRHVDGMDLPAWVQSRGGFENITESERFEIVAQAAEALQAAHDCGVIHFDIKPSNILVGKSPGRPLHAYVSDFGIGRVVSSEALEGMTSMGFTQTLVDADSTNVSGTHLYMAPEIAAGKGGSARSDIYSLGVVLYQMVVGDFTRPVTTDWARHVADPLVREDLAMCFSGNPEERFAGAAQLAANLRGIEKRRADAETERLRAVALEKSTRRNLALRAAMVAVSILLALAGISLVAWMQSRKAEENRLVAASEARRSEEMRRAAAAEMAIGAERMVEEQDNGRALATFAQALRTDPGNRVAAQRIVSLLTQRDFALPWTQKPPSGETFEPPLHASLRVTDQGVRVVMPDAGTESVPLRIGPEIAEGSRNELSRNPPVAVSPDQRIAAIKLPFRIHFYELSTGQPLGKPAKARAKGYVHMRFSPDGSQLWLSSLPGGIASVLPVGGENSEEAFVFHNSPVARTAFDPSGRRLASFARDGLASIWSPRAKTKLLENIPVDAHLKGSGLDAKALLADGPLISSSGSFLFVPAADGAKDAAPSFLWDIRPGAARTDKPAMQGEKSAQFAFSPDSRLLAFANEGGGVMVWNLESNRPDRRLEIEGDLWDLEFSADGKWIAAGTFTGRVQAWNSSGPETAGFSKDPGGRVRGLAFSPKEGKLAAITNPAAFGASRLHVWSLDSGKESFPPLEQGNALYVVKFSPDGRQLLIAGKEMEPALVDAGTGTIFFKLPKDTTLAADFDPSGKRLLLGGGSKNEAVVYSIGRSEPDFTLPHSAGVVDVKFSKDGKKIATASMDGTARVWDADSGTPLSEPLRHVKRVNTVDFDPTGLCLLTIDYDGKSRVWDSASGQPVSDWIFQDSEPGMGSRAAFSPDGRWMTTSGPRSRFRVSNWITVEPPPPAWLADLAEAVGGFRLNDSKTLEPSPDSRETLKTLASLDTDGLGSLEPWLEWFLAPRDNRTIAPWSKVAVKDAPPEEPDSPTPAAENPKKPKGESEENEVPAPKPKEKKPKESAETTGLVVGFKERGKNGMIKLLEVQESEGRALQLVFFQASAPEFSTKAVQAFVGKRISASGVKREYRGRDQIQIASLEDVRILDRIPKSETPADTDPEMGEPSNPPTNQDSASEQKPPTGSKKTKSLKDKVGRHVTVVGKVESFQSGPSKKVKFLKLLEKGGEHLSLTFFTGGNPEAFPDEALAAYVDQEVTVRGKISLYQNKPQMILESLEGIYVIQRSAEKNPPEAP
jgi:WD40 repeat protein/serine/threonine protein kinase/class 3 adenylate cyclase/DNA/RNA endonuclease YhcR with UshA esterase domain